MELGRHIVPITLELLEDFRALVLNGPRQSGKSTLLDQIQRGRGPVVSLDNATMRSSAIDDPVGFLAAQPPHVAIDEFQRGGNDLLLALKVRLDASNDRGQYLLAGSTRFLSTRTLSETLTGRVGLVELLPLSIGEQTGIKETFVDRVFDGVLPTGKPQQLTRLEYAELIARGGFPEMVLGGTSARFRTTWCESYLHTVTAAANVEQVAEVRQPDLMRPLLEQVAARSSGEVVIADLGRELQSSPTLVTSYLDVLSALYLIRLLPAWSTSQTNRAKKRPIAHMVDTGLAAHLLNTNANGLSRIGDPWFGPLLESFVVAELAKQSTWVEHPVRLSHYRDRNQREVDVILERGRQIVAIEVKATQTPRAGDARHLKFLRDKVGDRFAYGVVLHTGDQTVPLGDRLVAAPVSTLWATGG